MEALESDQYTVFLSVLNKLTRETGVKVEGAIVASLFPSDRMNAVGIQWDGEKYVTSRD